jgi:hypothetical protein
MTCSICFSDVDPHQVDVIAMHPEHELISRKHLYHIACAQDWYLATLDPTCPYCREPLSNRVLEVIRPPNLPDPRRIDHILRDFDVILPPLPQRNLDERLPPEEDLRIEPLDWPQVEVRRPIGRLEMAKEAVLGLVYITAISAHMMYFANCTPSLTYSNSNSIFFSMNVSITYPESEYCTARIGVAVLGSLLLTQFIFEKL